MDRIGFNTPIGVDIKGSAWSCVEVPGSNSPRRADS